MMAQPWHARAMVRDEQGYLTATHIIRTPELVEFEFELAGLSSRLLAWLLDSLISFAISAGVVIGSSLLGFISSGLSSFVMFVATFLVNWGYFTVFEWWGAGRTPGKRAMGLRVLQVNGARIGFTHAVLRNLLRAFDHFPFLYAAGGASALVAPARQRLGDLVAGTVVVREHRKKLPAALEKRIGATARSGALGRVEEKLRRASVAERELFLSAALRREELSMDARLAVFGELARYIEERFGLEKPEHYSDEKLVLEAVAALLQLEGVGSR